MASKDANTAAEDCGAAEAPTMGTVVEQQCAICHKMTKDLCAACAKAATAPAEASCTTSWGVCGHMYHAHCIALWLKRQPNCPLCQHTWAVATP